MTDKQLTALRAAGVWPEGLDYDTDDVCAWRHHNLMLHPAAAEALFIVEMMERLSPEKRMMLYRTKNSKMKLWQVERWTHGTVTINESLFTTLLSALVAAGIVEEIAA